MKDGGSSCLDVGAGDASNLGSLDLSRAFIRKLGLLDFGFEEKEGDGLFSTGFSIGSSGMSSSISSSFFSIDFYAKGAAEVVAAGGPEGVYPLETPPPILGLAAIKFGFFASLFFLSSSSFLFLASSSFFILSSSSYFYLSSSKAYYLAASSSSLILLASLS